MGRAPKMPAPTPEPPPPPDITDATAEVARQEGTRQRRRGGVNQALSLLTGTGGIGAAAERASTKVPTLLGGMASGAMAQAAQPKMLLGR